MQLNQLEDGATFRVPMVDATYQLLYKGAGSAYVKPTKKKTKRIASDKFSDLTGEFKDIEASEGATHISLATPVEEIEPESVGVETLTGEKPVKLAKAASGKRGERDFAPAVQMRPVREGTTRAKMLSMLLGKGRVDVAKVMKEFGFEKNLVVAHVHEMHKCHGYGYTFDGQCLNVVAPLASKAGESLL